MRDHDTQETTAKLIWEQLSKVDVSDHVEKKGNLSYLSWAWAWGTLMDYYPESQFEFKDWDGSPAHIGKDGTASVECTIFIDLNTEGEEPVARTMWLPVMDHRNKAIQNPDSLAISNAKMRCLTKCIALFGLGHYLYAGEDLPAASSQPTTETKEKPNGKSEDVVDGVVNAYRAFAEDKKNTSQLRDWWRENLEELKKLERSEPATYREILGVFTERKEVLRQEEADGQ